MNSTEDEAEGRVQQAYAWAAGLIDLAHRLVGDGVAVDVAPIRPAVRDLCELVRLLPPQQAGLWVDRLVGLQERLEHLGTILAEREAGAPAPQQP